MSNETFQFIIAAAVGLALVSILVQCVTLLALYRSARQMATRFTPFFSRAKAILEVEKESVRRVEIAIDKTLLAVDIIERVAPRIGTLAARVENMAVHAIQFATPVADLERDALMVGTAAHFMSLEMRPRLAALAAETSALAGAADTQFRRVGRVLHDAVKHFVHLRQIVASR